MTPQSRPLLPLPACRRECRWWATAASAFSFAAGFVVGVERFPAWVLLVLLAVWLLIVATELGR